jgi:predicted nucleic acid-binding protein
MPKVTFDTNIFISRPTVEIYKLPDAFYMSVVVLQELIVGAEDEAEIKKLNSARRAYEKEGRLLVPNSDDWWEVGKIINRLQRQRKSKGGGSTPKLAADEKYRITNDVLIARTARRAGVTLITDNAKDFALIQNYCKVRIMSGDEYFGEAT